MLNNTAIEFTAEAWDLAFTYGGGAFSSLQAFLLSDPNDNITSTLYSATLSSIDLSPMLFPYLNATPLAEGTPSNFILFPDTVILRGVSSLRTEYWDEMLPSIRDNMTCGIWATQNPMGGAINSGIQICLAYLTSQLVDPYLLLGSIPLFRDSLIR
jgi:hypothetical protein